MIERELTVKLQKAASQFPVLAIIGPRQSGKTTLVRHTFSEKPYVNLEALDTQAFAREDPRGFLENYPAGAIIDEAQRVPELFSYIQVIVDELQQSGMFILTGSQNFLIQENLSQTLAGRVAIFTLLPLSLEELKAAQHPLNRYEEYIFRGFYPRIYDKKIPPGDWYPSYIRTYLERDVRQIKNTMDLSLFQKFIKLCAGRIGQLLNMSALGNDCGISHNTVRSWLSLLEASYVIFLLQPHHNNLKKRIVKMPKLYFYDTGVACTLLNIQFEQQLETHYLTGNLFENLVISELIKYRLNRGLSPNVYFWRDRTGNEIDCLLEFADHATPVEIKSGRTVTRDYFKGLFRWNKLSGGAPSQSYVVYGGNETQKRSDGNLLPWKSLTAIFEKLP